MCDSSCTVGRLGHGRDDCTSDVLDELFDWLRWVDATFSTFKDDSEISRINRDELRREDAHPDVAQVLEELRKNPV